MKKVGLIIEEELVKDINANGDTFMRQEIIKEPSVFNALKNIKQPEPEQPEPRPQQPDNGWIPVWQRLPEKETPVLCKVVKLAFCANDYAVGYIRSYPHKSVWMIEGHHVTHHKDAVNNCVTEWKPIT